MNMSIFNIKRGELAQAKEKEHFEETRELEKYCLMRLINDVSSMAADVQRLNSDADMLQLNIDRLELSHQTRMAHLNTQLMTIEQQISAKSRREKMPARKNSSAQRTDKHRISFDERDEHIHNSMDFLNLNISGKENNSSSLYSDSPKAPGQPSNLKMAPKLPNMNPNRISTMKDWSDTSYSEFLNSSFDNIGPHEVTAKAH